MSNKKNQLITIEVKDYAYYKQERLKTVREIGLWDWFIIQFKLFVGMNMGSRIKVVYFLSVSVLVCAIIVLNVMSFVNDISPSSAANTNKVLKAFQLRDSLIRVQIEASEAKASPPDKIPPKAPAVKNKPIGAAKQTPLSKKSRTVIPTSDAQYIAMYKNLAISEMHRTGVLASITLGQGLIESTGGTSWLAKNTDNHFGIKCPGKKCRYGGGNHCENRKDDYDYDRFIKYASVEESYKDHSDFLRGQGRWKKKTNYKRLFTYGKDFQKWAYGLKSAGYATDRKYATTLINKIKQYELYKYDK